MATRGRRRKDGTARWRAHWREDNERQRNQTFETKGAALAWEAKMRREKDDRTLGLNTLARETRLDDWITEWWDHHVAGGPLSTQENYEHAVNNYIAPEIGPLSMIDLTPARIARWRDDLLVAGVSASEVDYARTVLSSCLGQSVERGFFTANPVRDVKKPRTRVVRKQKWPVAPEEVEWLRREFLTYRAANSGAWLALRSATMTALGAYAGLRPSEFRALKLGAYKDAGRVLIIEDVFAADHREGDTKTHEPRVVQLQDALVDDLRLWIDVLGATHESAWLFPDKPGGTVTRSMHRNWAARPWTRARDAVVAAHPDFNRTLGEATPRDLRGAYVSLLARAGWSDADICEETGHSVEVLRKHYLGAIKMLRRQPRRSEGEQIRLARETTGTPEIAQKLRRELLSDAARPRVRLVEAKAATESRS